MVKPRGSPSGQLNSIDWKKIGKGAAIAFGGAAIAQLSLYLSSGVAFDWKVWLGGILAVGINAAWKYFEDNSN